MPGFIWSGIRIDRTKQIHKKGRCEKPVPKINMKPFTKKIVLENGREFYGYGFGADREVINEIVFNTSMVGVSGDYVRPLLHGPDGRDDLSADR